MSAEKLRATIATRPAIGAWSLMNSPIAMDALGRAGLDFVVIDLEHGPSAGADVHTLSAIAARHGVAPIVRAPFLSQRHVQQALDWGAAGVKIPNVRSAAEAATFLSYTRFPPDGVRGLSPFVAAAGFHAAGTAAFCAERRRMEFHILQVENAEGLECFDDLLQTDADAIFVGLYDLSRSLGVTPDSSRLETVLGDLAARSRAAGKVLGSIASSEKQLQAQKDMGIGYITYLADTHMLVDGYRRILNASGA